MLTEKEFQKICTLSRLHIAETETGTFLSKLNGIFNWIEQLRNIDTSSVDLEHLSLEPTPERSDTISMSNTRDDILLNTKFQKFNMFSVPKVVE